MANAIAAKQLAAQATYPTPGHLMSGDGGLSMMMGDFIHADPDGTRR